jgi:hypothetical protein
MATRSDGARDGHERAFRVVEGVQGVGREPVWDGSGCVQQGGERADRGRGKADDLSSVDQVWRYQQSCMCLSSSGISLPSDCFG